MTAKQILFGESAHARLVKGMNTLGARPAQGNPRRAAERGLDREPDPHHRLHDRAGPGQAGPGARGRNGVITHSKEAPMANITRYNGAARRIAVS